MSSTGSGYDYSCGTFSPDGRIFQVEYAQKAVDSSGTEIGLKCNDGVVIIVEKPQVSKMLISGSNRRIFAVDSHVGMCVTGNEADGRQVVSRARDESSDYRSFYGQRVAPRVLLARLGQYCHYFTRHGSLRPFGCACVLAGFDEDLQKPELYLLEPTGLALRYAGCSAGKGAQAAKTELEKLIVRYGDKGISSREAVKELTKILYTIRDPSKDKPFEIEMGWICQESGNCFTMVPPELVREADGLYRSILPSGSISNSNTASEEAKAGDAMNTEEALEDAPLEQQPMDI